MNRILTVTHTKDRHGSPLACVHGLPGDDADLNAAQLRRLARGLEAIADACDRGAGVVIKKTATYDLDEASQ